MSAKQENIIGSPETDARFWDGQQSYADTCAIRCQEFILEQFTGVEVDEGILVQEAIEHRWYAPGEGTPLSEVGNLLELHGVEVHRTPNATIQELASELGKGHKVIVGVDSGELWKDNPILEQIHDFFGIQGADHAVVVSGIDTSDPDHAQVIISDPGTGEVAQRYPLQDFLDAWSDSQFYMVSTAEAAPPHMPEMAHFDYELGHLPELLGMDWDAFEAMGGEGNEFHRYLDHFLANDGVEPFGSPFTYDGTQFADLCDGGQEGEYFHLIGGDDCNQAVPDDELRASWDD